MHPASRIELPLWGNLILATLAVATIVWCIVDVWLARRK